MPNPPCDPSESSAAAFPTPPQSQSSLPRRDGHQRYAPLITNLLGLTSLLSDEAPSCIKQYDIKTLFGRKVAIDASMSLYQFLIAVRQSDGQQMTSESGEVTSHLLGFFYRTLRMIDYGIKPVYVFDGKPPDLKKEVVRHATNTAFKALWAPRGGARARGGAEGCRYVKTTYLQPTVTHSSSWPADRCDRRANTTPRFSACLL